MLESSRVARGLFAAAWLAAQCALALTADSRPGAMGGFRMFSEASTVRYELFREVRGALVPVPTGDWNARDASGTMRRYSWRERVRRPELCAFGVELAASYGAATQTERLHAALDDVFLDASGDAETTRLVLIVTTRRNRRPPETARLESFPRAHRAP
ncbi:MAG: hypothetical protein IPF92_08255 [Myxococcales bacterium]|nr:hypothetical protein [Myxococcales bacterium]MBL0193268.1 hypothetical protein [Myxococcales bacterium]HQY60591.1 hypothetical protein [Polyangiaceae bacterium]